MSNNLMFFKLKWEEYALSLPFVIILQILSLPFGLSWLWTCLCRHKQSCYLLLSSFLFCFIFVFVLFCVLRQDFSVKPTWLSQSQNSQPRMALNSQRSPAFLSVGIKGTCRHCPAVLLSLTAVLQIPETEGRSD